MLVTAVAAGRNEASGKVSTAACEQDVSLCAGLTVLAARGLVPLCLLEHQMSAAVFPPPQT